MELAGDSTVEAATANYSVDIFEGEARRTLKVAGMKSRDPGLLSYCIEWLSLVQVVSVEKGAMFPRVDMRRRSSLQ